MWEGRREGEREKRRQGEIERGSDKEKGGDIEREGWKEVKFKLKLLQKFNKR